ncbi:DUF4065 domain-containing protein [Dolichospermum sp. ST_sed3]|nr:DUF4065 domain-containing protein [Dolichospermum sp. ST_sed3]
MKNTKVVKKGEGINVFDIANYFIDISLKNEIDEGVTEGITNLRLQKILYFSQCAYLSVNNEVLFTDEIEAWKYGPVIPSVYHKYKDCVNKILELPSDYTCSLNDENKNFLNGIWELFSKYSVNELIHITHNHTPWVEAYKKGANTIIEKDTLKEYYKKIFKFQ